MKNNGPFDLSGSARNTTGIQMFLTSAEDPTEYIIGTPHQTWILNHTSLKLHIIPLYSSLFYSQTVTNKNYR